LPPSGSLAALVEGGLLYVLAPVWLLAGFADFACHRILRIEHTAGVRESMLHLLMLAQLGVAILCALLLETTALVFAVMLAACLAHEITTCADLAYAERRRRIPWFEQWVHALQQSFPWAWLVGWMIVQAPQALALVGLGEVAPVWELRPRQPALPMAYLLTFFSGAAVLVVAPFAYEFWRCARADKPTGLAGATGAAGT
jgi:hypothetical protein